MISIGVVAAIVSALAAIAAAIIAAISAQAAAGQAARISYSNKIAEFRQGWINDLREDIADYVGAAELWFRKWEELNSASLEERARREASEALPLSVKARTILNRIRLRLNPPKTRTTSRQKIATKSRRTLEPRYSNPP